jgi:hypothetical protein
VSREASVQFMRRKDILSLLKILRDPSTYLEHALSQERW